jgi:hypothetical protein
MILGLMLTMVILALLWDTPTSWLAGWGGGLLPGLAGCSVLLLLARHRGPRLPPWLGGDRAPAPTPEQDPEHEVCSAPSSAATSPPRSTGCSAAQTRGQFHGRPRPGHQPGTQLPVLRAPMQYRCTDTGPAAQPLRHIYIGRCGRCGRFMSGTVAGAAGAFRHALQARGCGRWHASQRTRAAIPPDR